jgi:hypothetical protein
MADNVANLAIKLTASSAGLDADLKKATDKFASFGKNISQNVFGSLGRLAGAPGQILGGALSPLQSLPFVGGSLGALGSIFNPESMKESLGQIVEMGREANKLGLTIKELSGIMNVGGLESDSFAHAMGHLQKELVAAVVDPEGAEAKKFANFGMDAEGMLKAGNLEALKIFADRIATLGTNAERTYAELELLGKGGQAMHNFLSRGRGGIEAGINKSDENGWTMSESEFQIARARLLEIKELERDVSSLKRGVAVGAASLWGDVKTWWNSGSWIEAVSGHGSLYPGISLGPAGKGEIASARKRAGIGTDGKPASEFELARIAAENRMIEQGTKDAERAQHEIDADRKAFIHRVAGKAIGMFGQEIPQPGTAEYGSASAFDNIAKWAAGTIGQDNFDMKELVKQEIEAVQLLERIRAAVEGETATMVIPGSGG